MKKIENEEEKKKEFKENLLFVGAILTFAAIVGCVLMFHTSDPQIVKVNNNHAILFESSTCLYCQKFIKETLSNGTIWDKLMDMNLTIMTSAGSVQEVEEEWPQFKGLRIYVMREEVEPYLNMFEISGIPTLVIVTGSEGGNLKYDKYEGFMDENELIKVLDKY